jgi:hypothetical protein
MAKQALDVHVLTIRRNQIHYERWRHVQVPLQEHKLERLQPALDSLDALEVELNRPAACGRAAQAPAQ